MPREKAALDLSIRIPATADAPRRARRALDGWLNDLVGAARVDDVRLLATELVSNALRHGDVPAGETICLTAETSGSSLTVRVEQPTSASSARVVERSADREGGFGLRFVDRLADSWGVEDGVPGAVWFAIGGPQAPS